MFSLPDFTLRQLGYLTAVADAGTIAAAAAELSVSASTLSDALADLDRIVGTPLTVRRRAHGVSLTGAGAHVVERARPLLAASREIMIGLRGEPGELVGPITIGCYPTLAPTVLPPLLHDFGEAHPRVDLHIREATHDQLEGRIESGEVDVAFVYDTLVPGHPRRERLFALPAHVLLAADDPLAQAETVRLEDLASRDLILLDAPPSSAHTLSLFEARGLTPRIRHRTASYEAVRTLVGRGLGYGILVQRPANPASYEGYPVAMKEISPPVEPVGIDVIWSATIDPPDRVRALVAFARSISWTSA
ncbi:MULTISPECIES: LysR substrate-binding domain-containing protein [Microbacterium]|jgi:DNA-binding transcriptional LysR family regulator|uniref:LysR substrate-binding domain-containing protein n=1 Tax=Microbacterium TaxID=33882 RepID=UPI001D17A767|nr:LysR substrate-binding domain-containing protein [Microbacterium testaceum]MCC4248381.1 LysR family transcriptional regulator [Microbacterium testaceum]